MIPNRVYLGADVSKSTIDCRFLDQTFSISNDRVGFAKLHTRIKPLTNHCLHVVVEATGGYQNALVAYLHAHDIARERR